MQINGFDWDSTNIGHIQEHSVSCYEVEEAILFDKVLYDRGRDGAFVAWGMTENGRYLMIVLIRKSQNLIRVITAREMSEREKHNYRKRREQ